MTFPSLPKKLRAPKDADLAWTMAFSCKLNEVSHGAHICFLPSVCPVPLSSEVLAGLDRGCGRCSLGMSEHNSPASSTGNRNTLWTQEGKLWLQKMITWLLSITFLLLMYNLWLISGHEWETQLTGNKREHHACSWIGRGFNKLALLYAETLRYSPPSLCQV